MTCPCASSDACDTSTVPSDHGWFPITTAHGYLIGSPLPTLTTAPALIVSTPIPSCPTDIGRSPPLTTACAPCITNVPCDPAILAIEIAKVSGGLHPEITTRL